LKKPAQRGGGEGGDDTGETKTLDTTLKFTGTVQFVKTQGKRWDRGWIRRDNKNEGGEKKKKEIQNIKTVSPYPAKGRGVLSKKKGTILLKKSGVTGLQRVYSAENDEQQKHGREKDKRYFGNPKTTPYGFVKGKGKDNKKKPKMKAKQVRETVDHGRPGVNYPFCSLKSTEGEKTPEKEGTKRGTGPSWRKQQKRKERVTTWHGAQVSRPKRKWAGWKLE